MVGNRVPGEEYDVEIAPVSPVAFDEAQNFLVEGRHMVQIANEYSHMGEP